MEATPRASPPPPPPQAVPQLWQPPGVVAGDARDNESGTASEGGGTERSCSSVGDDCCTRSQAACAARMMCCAWPRADSPRAARSLAGGRARAASLTTLRALLPRQAVSSTAELDAYLSSQHRGGGSDAENRGQGRRPTRTTQRKTGQTLPAPQAPSTRTAMSHAARHQPVAPRGFALFPADRQV
jgi:hypothetical protein